MNNITEQTPPEPESFNNEMVEDEMKGFSPQNQLPFPKVEVDLNEVFPDEKCRITPALDATSMATESFDSARVTESLICRLIDSGI